MDPGSSTVRRMTSHGMYTDALHPYDIWLENGHYMPLSISLTMLALQGCIIRAICYEP
ncbi:hypothetical protein DL93DRAFT_2092297 [Clavulina sp. PMI_390]|nr:hypothetical protein DL93DRAFT_2092311 [Clavulina sp. PMI_390]KAF8284633.1 hypothetical protein DL93DRAFT_2092297 [Clavulina sp. PMI_390]